MNLMIPAPSDEIPYGPTLPAPTASKRTYPKKGKMMEPSKVITACNLNALNYLKEHPGTTAAEFKKVFNNLKKETRKKYDVHAKETKKTSHHSLTNMFMFISQRMKIGRAGNSQGGQYALLRGREIKLSELELL
ncbi:hypothetical protein BU17DRAFT_60304 [Hysterangium stoloniferum]|nr:hypothetical protein BU17DRAFT_60304 [Hysterangium stoloniferum]